MFDQFGIYSEIEWHAAPAAVSYGPGDKIPVSPDLDNFKLERVIDLRTRPRNKGRFKLMLAGTSKTNVFINGPDSLIDVMVERLPCYMGKSWSEIENMRLGKDASRCKKFLIPPCDPLVIDYFEWKVEKPGELTPEPKVNMTKVDEICINCKHFEYKP